MNILVIEDNADTSQGLKIILESFGHIVKIMPGGRQALDLLALDSNTQAIILDHIMPNMNGLTFLKELRLTPGRETLPVILATGADIELSDLDINNTQPIYLLKKPFDPQHLLGILHGLNV